MGSVFGGQAFLIVVIGGERSRVKGESQERSKVKAERSKEKIAGTLSRIRFIY